MPIELIFIISHMKIDQLGLNPQNNIQIYFGGESPGMHSGRLTPKDLTFATEKENFWILYANCFLMTFTTIISNIRL